MAKGLPPKWWWIDFVLPGILLLGCLGLLFSGRNSEVKSILAVAAGWLFHAGVTSGAAKQ